MPRERVEGRAPVALRVRVKPRHHAADCSITVGIRGTADTVRV
ncbi:MAG TPA: hypothetical protein VIL58_02390 [Thermoplasmata archaeon]